MRRKKDGQWGVPGEGKGRRDEVGPTGIWPVSGPLPPEGKTPIVGQGELADGPRHPRVDAVPVGPAPFETDPVCGSRISTTQGERSDFNGHAYYFDSVECRLLFEEAPNRFATVPDLRR